MTAPANSAAGTPWYAYVVATGIGIFAAELIATFLPTKGGALVNAVWAALFAAPGSIALGIVWPHFGWRWGLVLLLAAGVALAVRAAVDPGATTQWIQSHVPLAVLGFLASACLWSFVGSAIGRLRPSNRTPHPDARDTPAHANDVGTRAGGRGR
jgi:hypothetical protein